MCFKNFVFERYSKCTCLGVKLVHHYLFRVQKKLNNVLGALRGSNPTAAIILD